jgi:hypothetical protein
MRALKTIKDVALTVGFYGETLVVVVSTDFTSLLNVEIRFRRTLDIQQVESAISRIKSRIMEQEPTMERIFIDPDPSPEPSANKTEAA